VINPATGQPESFYLNASGTKSCGFKLSGVFQPSVIDDTLCFDANLTCNHAGLKDAFSGNPAGSFLADSPEWLGTGGVTWEATEWAVANVSGKYTAKRNADYSESYEMDACTVLSAYLDIGGPNDFGIPENVSLRLNVDNLLDEEVPTAFVFAGSAFFRPLNPRTVQASLTVRFQPRRALSETEVPGSTGRGCF
jgi:iron complex outermembrane recepter protein